MAREFEPARICVELAEAALDCPASTGAPHPLPREMAREDPAAVLTGWVNAAFQRLRFPSASPWQTAVCVLLQLGIAANAMSVAELADSIREYAASISGSGGVKCLDCLQVHDLSPVGDFASEEPGRSTSPVGALADFGAVAWADAGPHGMVWLTPLGRMLAQSLFFGAAPRVDDDIGNVVERIGPLPAPVQRIMIQLWFTGRSPADAVRELLAYAARRPGTAHGDSARLLAVMTGPDGMTGWREWAAKPGYGVYARDWLRDHGEPLPVEMTRELMLTDDLWRTVDKLVTPITVNPGPYRDWFSQLSAQDDGKADAILSAWRAIDHPAVPRLIEILRPAGRPRPPAPRGSR
jgi:hypothetical protein